MFHPPIFVTESRPGGANANHNLFRIKIWRKAVSGAATLLQEVVEWQFIVPIMLMIPVLVGGAGYLLIDFPSNVELGFWMFLSVLLGIASPIYLTPVTREMELRGKTCEAVAAHRAYGVDFEERFNMEAGSLTYYKQFKGWTLDRIKAGMLKKVPYAQRKYEANAAWVLKWKEKLEK